MEGRYFSSRSRPFQLGITTDADRGPETAVARFGEACTLRANSFQNVSVRRSAIALIATRNGDRISNGKARRTRFRRAMSRERQSGTQSDFPAQLHPTGGVEHCELFFQAA